MLLYVLTDLQWKVIFILRLRSNFNIISEEKKVLSGQVDQLEKEIISLRRIVDHQNEELEKYHAKYVSGILHTYVRTV